MEAQFSKEHSCSVTFLGLRTGHNPTILEIMFTWKLISSNPFPELDGGLEPGSNLRLITKANTRWTLGLPVGNAMPRG